ncbi:hypothetical protein Trco_004921 [Trichoderma cornu-damae]|uniref:Uncharacterized protein n=1 Tax=Trichoderma cornu-damae TaxID=654480 RepID=A0A9P8TUW4_9HYPO|nr:hypothetical protein Trco_004921 [Trichoderma cornu-damae]
MCKFRISVTLCACRDPACVRKTGDFGQLDSEVMQKHGGHILWISTYLREGPMCLDYFVNEDPDRIVVRYGMDQNNGNSKQDCKNRVFIIDPDTKRCLIMCDPCSTKSQEYSGVDASM